MKKEDLRMRLIIAQGNLKDSIYDDCGCFDEIALCGLTIAFACEDLLDKSSNDVLIQFDESVRDKECNLLVDGIYLPQGHNIPRFTITRSDESVGRRAFINTDREIIIDIFSELIRMCK